jgi:hypothetical protein
LRFGAITIASMVIITASSAQAQDDLAKKAREAQNQGKYLLSERLWRLLAFDDQCTVRDKSALSKAQGIRSLVASDTLPSEQYVPDWDVTASELQSVEGAEARSALDEIARRAVNTRIVILNEHHAFPRSRAFALKVAERLRPLGYDILAAETFTNTPDTGMSERLMGKLKEDGYPRRETGYYTSDPVFGGFVRRALALGYRPENYETTDYGRKDSVESQITKREQDQADNLFRISRQFPRSRMLVYVGFSHVAEAPILRHGGQAKWMAARLKELSGIDPLTVDQATFMPAAESRSDAPIFASARQKAKAETVALFGNDAPLIVGPYAGAVDLQIVHPTLPRRQGRPGWLFELGRLPKLAPANMKPRSGAILVKAFAKDDPPDATPLDQAYWRAGTGPPVLLLPFSAVRLTLKWFRP